MDATHGHDPEQATLGGHFWALDWEMTSVLHQHEDKRQTVQDVVDTLDMWVFIEEAYERMPEESKKRIAAEVGPLGKSPSFMGYDGNNEIEHMSIAQFLVKDFGRFQRFKDRSLNSDSPTVVRYRRMFSVFEPIRPNLVGRGLSDDELVAILRRL